MTSGRTGLGLRKGVIRALTGRSSPQDLEVVSIFKVTWMTFSYNLQTPGGEGLWAAGEAVSRRTAWALFEQR